MKLYIYLVAALVALIWTKAGFWPGLIIFGAASSFALALLLIWAWADQRAWDRKIKKLPRQGRNKVTPIKYVGFDFERLRKAS